MKRALHIAVVILALAAGAAVLFMPHYKSDVAAESMAPVQESVPVRLAIAKLGIDVPIEPVGVTDENKMAVPTDPDRVGWYRFGTHPGDAGNAVLAGHVNWLGGKPAVFANLHALEPGDIVGVTDNYGATDYFIVRELKRYRPTDDASEVFSTNADTTRLNLITCDGLWDRLAGTHEARLVVVAEKI